MSLVNTDIFWQVLLRARLKHTGGSTCVYFKQWEASGKLVPPSGPGVPRVLRETQPVFTQVTSEDGFSGGGKPLGKSVQEIPGEGFGRGQKGQIRG